MLTAILLCQGDSSLGFPCPACKDASECAAFKDDQGPVVTNLVRLLEKHSPELGRFLQDEVNDCFEYNRSAINNKKAKLKLKGALRSIWPNLLEHI